MKITKLENGKMFNPEDAYDIYDEEGYLGTIFQSILPQNITITDFENIINTPTEKTTGEYTVKYDGLIFQIWKGETIFVADIEDRITEEQITNLCNYLNKNL